MNFLDLWNNRPIWNGESDKQIAAYWFNKGVSAATENLATWKVDKVESYWFYSGRYTKKYVEVTFWYNRKGERRESAREHSCTEGEDWNRPDWAKNITQFNESLTTK